MPAVVLALAFALPIVPWTLHVSNAEGRFVPISTGGGKALFIGTYLPGNGLHLDVKRELLRQFEGREDIPATELSRISMTPLLNRVASEYPDLERDAALQKIGRENAERYLTEQPLDFAGMVGREDVAHVARLGRGRPLDLRHRSSSSPCSRSASPGSCCSPSGAAGSSSCSRRSSSA